MYNLQPIEKIRPTHPTGTLEVHSMFRTLQGEGPFTGYPAIFIRLAGCNLQCPACDTDYTSKRETLTPQEILFRIQTLSSGYTIHLIVITGGEPFRQDISDLCILLNTHNPNDTIQIESNGTLPMPVRLSTYINHNDNKTWFNIVCSPKTGHIHTSLLPYIIALKYVASAYSINTQDGLPILSLKHSASPEVFRLNNNNNNTNKYYFNQSIPIYIQPCDEQDTLLNQQNTAVCIELALKHGYIFQLQTHKYLNIE